MQKKSQFYLIMAAVIIVVITGLISIVNYAVVKPEPVQFYDLSKQLENEVNRVIDYGTYNSVDVPTYVDKFVAEFIKYAQEKDPNIGLIYIYGNENYLTVVNYGKDEAGVIVANKSIPLTGGQAKQVSNIRLDIGGKQIGKKVIEEKSLFGSIRQTFAPSSKTVEVQINNKIYTFDLRGQQYFFAIVKSEKENETYFYCGGPTPCT